MPTPLRLTLRSPSMEPTIPVGGSVTATRRTPLAVGQIVVIPKETIYVVHRLVARFTPLFPDWGIERGDAEAAGRLLYLPRVVGTVIFPDLPPPPNPRSQTSEIVHWLIKLLRVLVFKVRERLS